MARPNSVDSMGHRDILVFTTLKGGDGEMKRAGLSDFEKEEIWRGGKSGRTLESIGRSLGRANTHVRVVVAATGGFVPPPRRRSARVLSRGG